MHAQHLRFENYTTRDGLLSDHIYNMYEDSRGYLWIFSENGTQRFNGREFKTVLKNLSHRDAFMFCFFERHDGRIWVANSRGRIYEVINDSVILVKGTEKFGEHMRQLVSEIFQLHVDDSLNIYAASKRYTIKYIKKGDQYEPVDLGRHQADGLQNQILPVDNKLISVLMDADNRESVNMKMHTVRISTNPPDFFTVPGTFENLKYAKKFNSSIYMSFVRHIVKWNDTIQTIRNLNDFILNFTIDRNGGIFAACYAGGVYELDSNLNIVNNYFRGTICNDVLLDSQNGMWVSTAGHGLYHCSNRDNKYFKAPSVFGDAISFVKKVNQRLFVGTPKGAVFEFENDTFRIVKPESRSQAADVTNWNGKLVFARRHEAVTYHLNGDELTGAVELLPYSNDSLVGVVRRGIVIFNASGHDGRPTYFRSKVSSIASWNGRILLGTDDGVFFIKGTSLVLPENALRKLKDVHITKFRSAAGRIWIGTAGSGLYCFDGDTLRQFTFQDQVANVVIHNISLFQNYVLISTGNGLYKMPLDRGRNTTRLYNGTVTHAEVHEGKIYLATPDGLVIMPWQNTSLKPLNVTLASLHRNGKPISIGKADSLLIHGDQLEFQFDAIKFSHPVGVKYVLSGPFSDSGNPGDGMIKFSNLEKGHYELSVWPDEETATVSKYNFNVMPAWWQTPWFYVSAVIALIIVAFAAGWLVFTYNRRRHRMRAKLEQQVLEYQLVALKAQINPHFLSNCLTAIQQLIYDNKVKEANIYIARFGLLVRKILMYSDKSFISLDQELEVAKLNIELELLRFDNKFTYEISVDPSIESARKQVPALLINPVLENAIWHGLLPLGERRNGYLRITCSRSADSLVIVIEDNGVGRSKNKPASSNQPGERQSRGLSILRQRLENINQLYHGANAALAMEDLQDDDNKPAGVRVTISIPLNLEARHHETV